MVASPQGVVEEERYNGAPCRQSSPNSYLFGVNCCLLCQVGVLLAPVPEVLLVNYSFQVEMGLVAEDDVVQTGEPFHDFNRKNKPILVILLVQGLGHLNLI